MAHNQFILVLFINIFQYFLFIYYQSCSDFSYWSLFCDIVNPWSLWQLMLSGMFVHMSWSWGLRLFRVFHTQVPIPYSLEYSILRYLYRTV